MQGLVRQLGFVRVGHIAANGTGALSFTLDQEFAGNGIHARKCGWVYLWAKVDAASGQLEIVYVGKAGNTLRNRFGQHSNGFVNSATGRRHAERIRAHLAAGNERHQLHVYARKSPDAEVLGEAGISMCESEERAMITWCLRRNLRLWNYQAASQRSSPHGDAGPADQSQPDQLLPAEDQNVAIGLPQAAEEDNEDEPRALSREDAFMASISDNPAAQATVAELLNALADRDDVQIHYTFTGGADLRIRYLVRSGRPPNVASFRWQSRRDGRRGFQANLFLNLQGALDAGASEARERSSHQPRNVGSQAFFAVPGGEGALVPAALRSIEAFEQQAPR